MSAGQHSAEIADVICDHAGPCPPLGRGCRWVQFERAYTPCECGGWDERWTSRDKSIRLAGRTNHRRTCVNHEHNLTGRVCTDPACTIPRKPGRPMHGPHDFTANREAAR